MPARPSNGRSRGQDFDVSSSHGEASVTSLLQSIVGWFRNAFRSQIDFSERFATFAGILLFFITIGLSSFAPFFQGVRLYNFFLLSLLGLAGGLAGWFLGILISPLGSQRQGVKQIATAISAFWSGVIAANLDTIRAAILSRASWFGTPVARVRLLYCATIFLMALAGTFNSRFDDSQIDVEEVPLQRKAGRPPNDPSAGLS